MRNWILKLILLINVFAFASQASEIKNKRKKLPNIIIIFTDDQGYGDVGCYGAKGFKTPNLDKLAKGGIQFMDFTVANNICTPSRAALLTGRYPERWGYKKGVFHPHHKTGMPQSEYTIAEMLKEKGYSTALIGKWHLGHYSDYLPTKQGFDYFYGVPYSNDMWQDGATPISKHIKFFENKTLHDYLAYKSTLKGVKGKDCCKNKVPLMEDEKVIEWPLDQTQVTKRYTQKVKQFIKEKKGTPFFLYFAHAMPHTPLHVSNNFKGKTKRGLYGDVIQEIDWSLGEIVKTLKEQDLEEDTLIIFTSDNGPWLIKKNDGGSAGKLRGGKGTTYEGGHRVPCIMSWPKEIREKGLCNTHITSLDILPTIAKVLGIYLPNDLVLDGVDFSNIFKGLEKRVERQDFMYSYGEAIRIGDWKYRYGPHPEVKNYKKNKEPYVSQLFNLKEDPNERENLLNKYPERANEMAKILKEKYNSVSKK